MRFRPCIDLHEGVVKQIVGSSLRDAGSGDSPTPETNFVADLPPDYYAKLYRRHGLTGGHVIMLGKGCETAAEKALRAWPGGMQLGGGVHAGNASRWLDAGASQVIVTSWIFHDGAVDMERLKELKRAVGREHLVLDLSCRAAGDGYLVATDRWQKLSRTEVNASTLAELAGFACEFLIHAVDMEGKRGGIDGKLLRILADSPAPCVYAGGISSWEDIETIRTLGRGYVDYTVGSALDIFGGSLEFSRIVQLNSIPGQ